MSETRRKYRKFSGRQKLELVMAAVIDLFLHGATLDPATWEDTHEAKEFATRSCHAWGPVIQAAWGTSDDDIAAAIAFGVQHFAPETTGDDND